MTEQFLLLAAVIAAHPKRQVVGRTRLQKTARLLQRLGSETSYGYSIHFYGPYSEDLQSDVTLLERLGLVTEEVHGPVGDEKTYYYTVQASANAKPELVEQFRPAIALMARTDQVVLELAATYDAFRDQGDDHAAAMIRLERKKGSKCANGRAEKALALLKKLGLPAA